MRVAATDIWILGARQMLLSKANQREFAKGRGTRNRCGPAAVSAQTCKQDFEPFLMNLWDCERHGEWRWETIGR